jgi:hypothetical protein
MTRSGREVAATEIVEIFNPGAGALGGSRE